MFSTVPFGGDERNRTAGLLLARQALSQLSYTPSSLKKPQYRKLINVAVLFLHPRKEVIQPHLPIRLPCYDFTPVIDLTFDSSLLTVKPLASGTPNFHGVTGGVYKARERIHRDMLIRDY